MPVLQPNSKTEKLYLPSFTDDSDKAFVVLELGSITPADVLNANVQEGSEVSIALSMLANRIKEWNLTDAAGAVLPVTVDNISKLPIEDFNYLVSNLELTTEALSSDEKKTLLNTSLPDATTSVQVQ